MILRAAVITNSKPFPLDPYLLSSPVLVHSASFQPLFLLWPLASRPVFKCLLILGCSWELPSFHLSSQINFSPCISCLITGSTNFPVFLHLLLPPPFLAQCNFHKPVLITFPKNSSIFEFSHFYKVISLPLVFSHIFVVHNVKGRGKGNNW